MITYVFDEYKKANTSNICRFLYYAMKVCLKSILILPRFANLKGVILINKINLSYIKLQLVFHVSQ